MNNNIDKFKNELTHLINKYSIENEWDMPDFLISEMITRFIITCGPTMRKNLDWHGVDSVCHPRLVKKHPLVGQLPKDDLGPSVT